jgi:outer membrane lipoprotein-sorting protein
MTCSRVYALSSLCALSLLTAAGVAQAPASAAPHNAPASAAPHNTPASAATHNAPASAAPHDAPKPAAPAQPASFEVLLDAFSRMPGLEAGFVEEKHLALLAEPLESRGRLFFARPGLLVRRVEAPRRSEVVITQTELRMSDADGEQSIDLRSRPDVRPFVESLTWLLAGNRKALAEVYAAAFEPAREAKPWRITLTPKAGPIARLIQYIRIVGSGLAVSQIEVRETSGDETVTRIVDANPARHFSADELKQLFGSPHARGGHP